MARLTITDHAGRPLEGAGHLLLHDEHAGEIRPRAEAGAVRVPIGSRPSPSDASVAGTGADLAFTADTSAVERALADLPR